MGDPLAGGPHGLPLAAPGLLPVILDGVADGIAVLDRDGRCIYLNESAGAMLGQAPAGMLGSRLWNQLPEDLRLGLRQACEAAAETGVADRLVGRSAKLGCWFEFRVLPHDGDVVIVFRDVTDEQLAHDELVEHLDRNFEAERIVGFGVWRWELRSGRVRWSDELHRIYGLAPGDFGGTVDAFISYLHPEDRERVWATVSRSVETLEPFIFEERIMRPDGEERVLLSKGRVIADSDGSAEALVGVCYDVTERARIERALGASERRMRAIIDNSPSVISVKDLSGRYLMSNLESGRVLGMETDEIVGKYCTDLFPPEIAEAQRANDARAASEGDPVYDDVVFVRNGEPRNYVTSTFVLPDEEGFALETCTIATDVTERRDYETTRRERAECAEQITSALAEDRMLVFGQPIIDLRSGAHAASELLVRLQSAGERPETLAPGRFLPAAESFGLIQPIDIWMVRQATVLSDPVVLEVNISAVTMSDPAARREIVELLAGAPAAAARIVFEITETAAATHLDATFAFAKDIERLGCRLALDDFGTGFGSFTYLRKLPLSFIKIDVSFVRGMVESLDDRRVVQSIIGIAKQFDLATVAEGVENEATLELVRELGADFAQGFHIGRPAPIAAVRH